MKLGDFMRIGSGEFDDFEIEDAGFFRNMIGRMIEDLDVGVYVIAREHKENEIAVQLMRQFLNLIGPPASATASMEAGSVSPEMVREYARAPIDHADEALSLLARFLNFHLEDMLRRAATAAAEEGLQTIKLRHILPGCERWPWPLNRYC